MTHVISDMAIIRSTLDFRDETRAWGRNMKTHVVACHGVKIRVAEHILPRRISKDRNATQVRRKQKPTNTTRKHTRIYCQEPLRDGNRRTLRRWANVVKLQLLEGT